MVNHHFSPPLSRGIIFWITFFPSIEESRIQVFYWFKLKRFSGEGETGVVFIRTANYLILGIDGDQGSLNYLFFGYQTTQI